jgi:hypothetical protein
VKLRRWEIVFVRADENDTVGHPGVVLSHEGMLDDARQQRFNVHVGTKKQPAETPRPHHVILDGADGLEFATYGGLLARLYGRKSSVLRSAGAVAPVRRQEIQRRVRAFLGLG